MSYCCQHIVKIVKEKEANLVDYAEFQMNLSKVNSFFSGNNFSFVVSHGYLLDRNWNYGFGSDWDSFENDMRKVSELMKDIDIKCAYVGEAKNDTKYLHYRNGEVLESKKLTKKDLEWFNSVYCAR